jgi:hypothetical protein
LVTFTRVPNGSFLCAAVRPSGRNGSPLAVPAPELYCVAFIEPLRQTSWLDAAKAAPPEHIETSKTGRVSTGLTGMIHLLLRRPSDTVSRNGEQGRQRKTENQSDLFNVVLCDKPEIATAAGATDREGVR